MNILVVDDDVDSCNDMAKFLKRIGHMVTQAFRGNQALDLIDKFMFDLLISDVSMPEIDGIEVVKRLKNENKNIKIILISGLQEVAESINAIDLGIYDFITKPVDINKIIKIIEEIDNIKKPEEINKFDIENILKKAKNKNFVSIKDLDVEELSRFKNKNIEDICINSQIMLSLFKKLEKLHEFTDIPVLIAGETGTGKELVAKYLHFESKSNNEPFVAINCAAINKEMFEAELFGYEKGAFTGSRPEGRDGFIKLAEKGSLFLDEITELSLETQAKLLRVLQEKEYYKVSGSKKEIANTRFIFATNANIEDLVKKGLFRDDLYFRLNLCKLKIPSLKERKEEIIPLTVFFINSSNKKFNKNINKIEVDAIKSLYNYYWPGNIRELKNIVTQAIIFNDTDILTKNDIKLVNTVDTDKTVSSLNMTTAPLPETSFDLELFINSIIKRTLEKFNGNKTKASEYLGISRMKLYNRYKL